MKWVKTIITIFFNRIITTVCFKKLKPHNAIFIYGTFTYKLVLKYYSMDNGCILLLFVTEATP